MIALNDLARHHAPLRAALDAAIARVEDRGHYILGAEVEAFEREFAAWCGADSCIAVANGTDALELVARDRHARATRSQPWKRRRHRRRSGDRRRSGRITSRCSCPASPHRVTERMRVIAIFTAVSPTSTRLPKSRPRAAWR
jgi:hypothetical protein